MIGALLGTISSSRWTLRLAAMSGLFVAILLFLLNLRRAGEQTGRLTERLKAMERTNAIQHRMLETTTDRPRDRNELVDRLRRCQF